MQLSFQKIATVPASGLVAGRIYFETSTGMIKVATSATTVDKFGDGVKSASWDESAKTLKIINESGEEISLNLSDVASASAVTTELAKKLSLGSSGDAAGTQSYYGLKKDISAAQTAATNAAKTYTDGEIAKIPAAIVYKADGTTITQSGDSTVTFTVGTIAQNKVTGLESALASKASTTDLNAVKATAEAAAPQATTYTKTEVDNKVSAAVGSVYKIKGSVDDATALQALTGVAIGDTYNVIAAGSLNGEPFEAGSNFVAIKAGAGNQEGMWDKLGGTIDLSAYARSADVANTYATKTAVTSEIATKIGTLDKADTAVEGQVVSAVSETDGIITVSRRALVETDIPTIGMTKISGLSTALSGKVGTSTTVNGKTLSQNITLAGEDILVGGTGTYKDDDLQAAIEAMDTQLALYAKKAGDTFTGPINLAKSSNKINLTDGGTGWAVRTTLTTNKNIGLMTVNETTTGRKGGIYWYNHYGDNNNSDNGEITIIPNAHTIDDTWSNQNKGFRIYNGVCKINGKTLSTELVFTPLSSAVIDAGYSYSLKSIFNEQTLNLRNFSANNSTAILYSMATYDHTFKISSSSSIGSSTPIYEQQLGSYSAGSIIKYTITYHPYATSTGAFFIEKTVLNP